MVETTDPSSDYILGSSYAVAKACKMCLQQLDRLALSSDSNGFHAQGFFGGEVVLRQKVLFRM